MMQGLGKMKKNLSVLLAILMLLNILFSSIAVHAADPAAIAAWDYTAAPSSASVPATGGVMSASAVLTNFKNITPTYSSSALNISGGWSADTSYWQINLPTSGYENLTLSAKTRSSATGPRDFKVYYSVDNGSTWTYAAGSDYKNTASLGSSLSNLALPAAAANAANLGLRFAVSSNISVRAGTTSGTTTYPADEAIGSGGTSQINNIIISGTQIQNLPAVGAVMAAPQSGAVAAGSRIALACETEGASIRYSVNDGAYVPYDSNAQIVLDTLPCTIKAYGTKSGMTDGAVSTWTYTQAQVAAVTATPNGGAVTANSTVELACSTPNASIKYSLDNGTSWNDYISPITLPVLPVSIKTYATAAGMANSAESTFRYTEKSGGEYNLYFGQLHSHTTNSDGIGSLDDAYSHARDVAGVDFLAVTDHSNSFDNASASGMADGSKSAKWAAGHAAADKYTNGNFVGIYAYEMTWSNGTGHINTFNTPGFETRDTQIYKNTDGLQQYYNVLKKFPASISQFNHPGPTFGDFNDFAGYDPEIDREISLIEVGNGEGAVRSSGYFASYEYYTRALDKGWHLAPTNNQDNHLGLWGDANTARTVVLADSLTRDSIYDAMKNMRAYATEDKNLRIKYTLNGAALGSVLPQKPDSVDIKVDLEDPDNEALGTISVISNGGRVVASRTLAAGRDSVEFRLAPDYSYYYIRVDEADRDIAATAPVWIGEVDKAGISRTTASTTLPVKGEKLTVTSGFFNNESAAMSIDSLEYSINGSAIHTASSVDPVASLGTGSYFFDYTPGAAGKFNLDVKMTATVNGVQRTYTNVLKLNVADPALITKVVVDGSHHNDYVTGYYGGNMTNLITLANGENTKVVIQKEPLTDDVLKDAQLLILSAPAKKSGTYGGSAYTASPYTEDEIAVIQRFAARGGNLIVTAIADYQDSRTDAANHSAYQQNRILAAIGAASRINDDEVVDYENNPNVTMNSGKPSGTPYRVPMNVYDMNTPYLNGVVPAQNYSFYSGCSITPGSNAVRLVRGTPATYGFDSDNDKLGGAYVSNAATTIPADTGVGKGNVAALAVETLPGGGKLFVGGTVFYSNFEVKVQLDNATQLQNSNYNITMNILDSIKKVIPVTPIFQVRTAQTGDVYCVEGTVTAGTVKDNAFFDTIYIQDSTGGINIFPVSGADIRVGQKVKVTGYVDEYKGDRELRVIELTVTDTSLNPLTAETMTTKNVMDAASGGKLIRIEGVVKKMDSQNLYIDDGSGPARVFVDGYIGDGSGDPAKEGKWDPNIRVGDKANVIGLASVDEAGPRLRVRNTAEIVRIKDTVPPVITIEGVKDGGFYNKDVTPVIATDEGTLMVKLNNADFAGGPVAAEGPYTLEASAEDRDGNASNRKVSFMIDKTAPEITVEGIKNGDAFMLNQPVKVTWNCRDALSGIDSSNGDIVSGGTPDTSRVGSRILTFTAADKAGNVRTVAVTYTVRYKFSGFLMPLNQRWPNTFRRGIAIPVQFQLKDFCGRSVSTANAKLYTAKVTKDGIGPETMAASASRAVKDNTFRYDKWDKKYEFQMSTGNLEAGTYQLRIDLGDGTVNTIRVSILR